MRIECNSKINFYDIMLVNQFINKTYGDEVSFKATKPFDVQNSIGFGTMEVAYFIITGIHSFYSLVNLIQPMFKNKKWTKDEILKLLDNELFKIEIADYRIISMPGIGDFMSGKSTICRFIIEAENNKIQYEIEISKYGDVSPLILKKHTRS